MAIGIKTEGGVIMPSIVFLRAVRFEGTVAALPHRKM